MDDDNYHIELLMRMVGMMIYDQRSESIICVKFEVRRNTRSSWLNCALRDDEAVYLVSRGHYEAVAVGN